MSLSSHESFPEGGTSRQGTESMVASPSLAEAFWVWVKVGLLSFGGPTGQIALMHTELVERRRWVSDNRFLHALHYCMLLPGPEAHRPAPERPDAGGR
jgi:chromate transporter